MLKAKRKGLLTNFSGHFFKAFLSYGFPHIFVLLGTLVMGVGDRYVIQLYLGEKAVGTYAVGYSLVSMAITIISKPLNLIVFPLYTEKWEKGGLDETKAFLSKAANYYLTIAIPVTFAFLAVGRDILILATTQKFADAHIIFPYVIMGLVINGLFLVTVAGLYIHKQIGLVGIFTLGSAILNIILNVLLVPKKGIIGAAIATLITYIVHFLVITYYAFKKLSFSINIFTVIKYTLVSWLIYKILPYISLLNEITLKICIVFVIYVLVIILLSREIRNLLISFIRKSNT